MKFRFVIEADIYSDSDDSDSVGGEINECIAGLVLADKALMQKIEQRVAKSTRCPAVDLEMKIVEAECIDYLT